jgi:hypothetical protein
LERRYYQIWDGQRAGLRNLGFLIKLSALVLRRTPGVLTFPLAPFLSHTGRGRGNEGDWRKRTLATPHVIVARARYVPNQKSGILDQALRSILGHQLELFNVFTLPGSGEGGERVEKREKKRRVPARLCRGTQMPVPTNICG